MAATFLAILVLASAAIQILLPFFVNPFQNSGQPVRGVEPSQIEPAGYAFVIWGPIYLGALVYAIWQMTVSGPTRLATTQIAPFAIALYVGSSLWLWAAKYGPLWATMPILAVMAVCAITCLVIAVRAADSSVYQTLVLVVPFALYAGWTLCATFVNIAEVAPRYGFDRFGLSASGYAVLSLLAVTVLAVPALWLSRGNLVFAGTIAWALLAIIVAAVQRGFGVFVPISAAASLVAVGAVTAWIQWRLGPAA
jgi:hypothetical protein